ncbi:MAG: HsdR family type I site-specific deoxyribonuclease [Deinococcota bacterium]
MSFGQSERATQKRVIKLFQEELGYTYLGNWQDREGNSNIEEKQLTSYLTRAGYSPAQISQAIYKLQSEASNPNRSLYANNHTTYHLLRYGVYVKTDEHPETQTVHLVNWHTPAANDFYIAEEVTLRGTHERRPDIVLYLNGIAVGVLELKRASVSIGDGIRQLISNQKPDFNQHFFSTVQFVFAGNDAEGLRYGTTGTLEKYFLTWKEDVDDNSRFKLDKYLLKMCNQARFIELMYNFVLFDGGVKKVPRVHQYFGMKATQKRIRKWEGGIIWHTQGSGKSMVMVLLAKWLLENNPHARVAIITDRDELDKQIEAVFTAAGEEISRSRSGRELLTQLAQATPRLLCSLVHKFGKRDAADFERFIADLEDAPSQVVGELYVFVDECHRTQSGKLNRTMKARLPADTVFIGFTGTPLLKQDKQTSLEVFGNYIHTYKFSEAVEDNVVLDLMYEARDIDQRLSSEEDIDDWFALVTQGLNDWQKDELRKKWGTMQKMLSSNSRMDRVVTDIYRDFRRRPRLSGDRGTAMLVARSIYEACKYFVLFGRTSLAGKCALVTSYNPYAGDISKEDTGAGSETDKQFIYNTYTELLQDVAPAAGKTKTETYEDSVKKQFRDEPANMKLLIVVDKLLTGFDAPSCSYLYIDKSMQDHGLFQAICRTNRLDGDDKDFGYIVDYKDLFKKVETAIAVYASELDHSAPGIDPDVLMKERLSKAKERLDTALETLHLLCEPVAPPAENLEHIHYFCGNTEKTSDLKAREPQRAALYKSVASLVRAYANLADELGAAGYTPAAQTRLKEQLKYYVDLRAVIRNASSETLDLKAYEADMRHLIDSYIEADAPRQISPFDDMPLLEIMAKTGIDKALDSLPDGIKENPEAVAATIENNVRSKIIKEHLSDPVFYASMSALLDELVQNRKAKALEYEAYLAQIAELAEQVQTGQGEGVPSSLDTPGRRALYNNLDQNEALALQVDATVKEVCPEGWRGVQTRERVIKAALYGLLQDQVKVEQIFPVIVQQTEY